MSTSTVKAQVFKVGDLITAIDGTPITSTNEFIADIDNYTPGQVVTLTIKRAGQTMQVKVTLGVRPAQTATAG